MDRWKKGNLSKALFSAQKITPEFLASQGKRKAALLKTLSRAIKEVQLLYANQESKGDSRAIGDCRPTQQLCARFEELLRHGLKAGWFGAESSFWPLVLKISRKQAIEYISSLQYAQTSSGKSRAWIRLAVNECSLESYITVLTQDAKLLSQYYESYSFLRDSEMVAALTQLLAGLSQINFNMTIDTASLEFGAAPEAVSQVQPALRLKVANIISTPSDVVASKSRTKRGKSHSLRQSPAASSQNLSVDDNSSSQASWSSDEEDHTHLDNDRTHHSPSLSWTSGDIDTEGITGTEYQNEAQFQSEAIGADYGNETGGTELIGEQDSTGDAGGAVDNERGNPTDCEPTLLETQFEQLTEEVEEPPLEIAELANATSSNLSPSTPPPTVATPFAPPTPPMDVSTSPCVSPPPSPILQTSLKLLRNSPSPIPVSVTSPSPVPISHTSPSPSPIPSSRNSPSPIPSPVPELHRDESEGEREDEREGKGKESVASNPFSPESDEVVVTEYNPTNPFEKDVSVAGMENEKNSDSELESDPESTLKPASTNPFIQLSDIPSAAAGPDNLNPFGETPTNPFDLPPPPPSTLLPSNPFDDNVITNDNDVIIDEPGAAASGNVVPQLLIEGEGEGQGEGSMEWSETSSTAEDTLPSLEETHCISLSVFQQGGKDSPSNLSAQYDKLSDLSSLLGKGSRSSGSGRSSQLDRLSEAGEGEGEGEWSRPESREKSDVETVSSFPSSVDLSLVLEAEPIDENLHPQENYFENEMNEAELERAIAKLKARLLMDKGEESSSANGEIRRRLVRLQTLRIKLKEMEEVPVESKDFQQVNGHQFVRQRRGRGDTVCEGCNKKISKITLKPWSRCKKCHCCCHNGCFTNLSLICTATMHNSQAANRYILEVCPELGLTVQLFRCASCNQAFNASSTNTSPAAARICDYSGRYYCPACHHNSTAVIPARVLHNWDFAQRKVCCRCFDLLERLFSKPLIRIDHINPLLYTYVPDISTIESLRRDILQMMKYLDQCESARESGLIERLDPFPHFKDTAKQFSMTDMELIRDGRLLPQLQQIHHDFGKHIRQTCRYCYSRGTSCLVCGSGESLFPFNREVKLCPQCKTIFHKTCYIELTSCPKCYRHRRTKA